MQAKSILPHQFYEGEVVQVARQLLGKKLVRQTEFGRISGIISETEAYDGSQDLACHARAGRTPRTSVMFGPPGHAYVYFTYGMHWCFNVVTSPEGYAAAVLIRALLPLEGLDLIALRRAGIAQKHWVDGPAKLTRALSIEKLENGKDLTNRDGGLWIEDCLEVDPACVHTSPRVGIDGVPEPWRSMPWRFWIDTDSLQGYQ